MRTRKITAVMILCTLSGTLATGCGETMRIQALTTLYQFGTSLLYEFVLYGLTGNTATQ